MNLDLRRDEQAQIGARFTQVHRRLNRTSTIQIYSVGHAARTCRMRLLFLSRWFPYPADNGAKLRIWNNLQHLAARHDVTLITFGDVGEIGNVDSLAKLRELCIDVRAVPYHPFRPSSARALAGFFSTQPRWLVDTHSPQMASVVDDEGRRRTYDVVIASQLEMAPYALQMPKSPALLDELELSIIREGPRRGGSVVARTRARLTWLKLRTYVRGLLPRFAACTVASDRELQHVRQLAPDYQNLHLIPNAVHVADYAGDFGLPEPHTLVYSGALSYHANYDAVQYYLGDIHPLVSSQVPQARVRITGSIRDVNVDALPKLAGVEYTGHVPDVRPVIARSWASLVPLRQGGGTRLKILEAMALGTPVISTSKGAEGLAVHDGHDVLIADTARAFAQRVIDLSRSPELRRHLADGGRRLVASRYDARFVGEQLCGLVESVGAAA